MLKFPPREKYPPLFLLNESNKNIFGAFGGPVEIWVQILLFNYILNMLILLAHLLLLLLIYKRRKSRFKSIFYVLLTLFSMTRVLACFWSMFYGTHLLFGIFDPSILIIRRSLCIKLHILSFFGGYFSSFILLLITIDRFFAIVTPRSYRSITGHHKYILMIMVSCLVSLLIPIGALIAEKSIGDPSIICINILQNLSTSFSKYAIYGHLLIGTTSVLIYVILTVSYTIFKWRP